MKIAGYKVEPRRFKGAYYWIVKNLAGEIVGQLEISATANRHGFGSTLSSSVYVEVRGPTYFKVADKLLSDGGVKSQDIHLMAMVEAQKAGHFKSWSNGGCSGHVAGRISEGRNIAKTKGWPALKEMLGVI